MAIKRVTISNFKSYKDLDIELGKFNVLIGANAAGKSNFIEIFRFLKGIAEHGLENAISMQLGVKYLRNVNIGPASMLSLEIACDGVSGLELIIPEKKKKKTEIRTKVREVTYGFSMEFRKRGLGFDIPEEKLVTKCDLYRVGKTKHTKDRDHFDQADVVLTNHKGAIGIEVTPPDGPMKAEYISPPPFLRRKAPPRTLVMGSLPYLDPFVYSLVSHLRGLSIYDFEPHLSKSAIKMTGKAELEDNGENLPIVLMNILEDKEKRRKLFNFVKDMLPFIDDLDVEKLAGKYLLLRSRESYSPGQYLPATLMSDGTINITALIIALHFVGKPLTIIEEPERNIHPSLISKVIDMMKDASRNKQVIATTHNPQVVKHAGLENILLVSRDKKGFSTISRPADKETVKVFLKNEMGVDELYVQNLLELEP